MNSYYPTSYAYISISILLFIVCMVMSMIIMLMGLILNSIRVIHILLIHNQNLKEKKRKEIMKGRKKCSFIFINKGIFLLFVHYQSFVFISFFILIPYFISYISIHLLIFFIQFSFINNSLLRIQPILLCPFYPASFHYQILSWNSIFLVFIRNQIKLTI